MGKPFHQFLGGFNFSLEFQLFMDLPELCNQNAMRHTFDFPVQKKIERKKSKKYFFLYFLKGQRIHCYCRKSCQERSLSIHSSSWSQKNPKPIRYHLRVWWQPGKVYITCIEKCFFFYQFRYLDIISIYLCLWLLNPHIPVQVFMAFP